ncbi:SprT family zinc-dependent metalloprotease [Ursidibacter maritimus]|uniref:SprT family zinc-dependent metalloprotease n=1 Tax=Ursidibacter maritimus TaxID=1331689 RepID=UPI001C4389D8|nr:SprT family zinc-dependent metalloprotease [Ursidibacter maritimus]MBV6541233.1 SprT family zinc-dependent metalloprotease [Ursidibacter maritimus]
MMSIRHLKMQVQRQLKRDLDKANSYFNKSFLPPIVNYDLKGMKAGVAYLQQNEIRLNPILLQENGDTFIQQVVPHELAHLLVYQQFGRVQPHGKEWRMVMETVLGVPAETYHCFDTTSVQGERFSYRCECQTHQLSIRRHNAILRQNRQYLCRKCKKVLVFVEKLGK